MVMKTIMMMVMTMIMMMVMMMMMISKYLKQARQGGQTGEAKLLVDFLWRGTKVASQLFSTIDKESQSKAKESKAKQNKAKQSRKQSKMVELFSMIGKEYPHLFCTLMHITHESQNHLLAWASLRGLVGTPGSWRSARGTVHSSRKLESSSESRSNPPITSFGQ